MRYFIKICTLLSHTYFTSHMHILRILFFLYMSNITYKFYDKLFLFFGRCLANIQQPAILAVICYILTFKYCADRNVGGGWRFFLFCFISLHHLTLFLVLVVIGAVSGAAAYIVYYTVMYYDAFLATIFRVHFYLFRHNTLVHVKINVSFCALKA